MKVLFVCLGNICRSRTAEDLYKNVPGLEVRSAGIAKGSFTVVTKAMLKWADYVFCMEEYQRDHLVKMLGKKKGAKKIICLDIPDMFSRGNLVLEELLKMRLHRYLGGFEVERSNYLRDMERFIRLERVYL